MAGKAQPNPTGDKGTEPMSNAPDTERNDELAQLAAKGALVEAVEESTGSHKARPLPTLTGAVIDLGGDVEAVVTTDYTPLKDGAVAWRGDVLKVTQDRADNDPTLTAL